MSETFPEFLNSIGADSDMVQQALRIHLSERTEDLTPEEMRKELREAATNEEELKRQIDALIQDPITLERVALIYFENNWGDETQNQSIRMSFQYAKDRLPVIESTLLAVVAMYGMYLLVTSGKTKEKRTITRGPDGSYKESEEVEYSPFGPVIKAISGLFGKTPQ